jgi:hypothetical protein
MFNLDQAIAEWRRQMAAGGIKSARVLDELESHLRDEIEGQIYSGASEQNAYRAAVAGIGRAGALKTEFAKLENSERRERRTFLLAFYFGSVAFMLLINTWTLLAYELSPLERGLGISAVSLVCLYLAWLPHWLKSLPSALYDRLARAIKMASSLVWVWPMWALLEAEHVVHLEVGIVPSTIFWCLFAAVAMSACAYELNGRCFPSGNSGGSPPPGQPHSQLIPPTRPCPPDFAAALPPSRPVDPIVHQSLEAAFAEASRLGHDYIGTEHVLLGLLKLAKGSFADVLRKLNLDREQVRVEVERLVFPVSAHTTNATIPFTPRARKAIRLAAREAATLNHSYLSADHLFLGLVLEGGGIAARALKNLGIHIENPRQEILSEFRAHSGC